MKEHAGLNDYHNFLSLSKKFQLIAKHKEDLTSQKFFGGF